MTLLALVLILVAAVIHATWNLFTKQLRGGAEAVWLFTLVATLAYAPLLVAVVLVTGYRPAGADWVFLTGTGLLQAAYFLLLRRGYAAGDLSVVYPVARGTGPLAATVLAVAVLGEQPSAVTLVGTGVVSLGILVMARASTDGPERTPLLFGVATGMMIGGYTAWDGYAVGTLAIPAVVMGWAADAGRLVVLTPLAHRRRSGIAAVWKQSRRAVISIGVLSTASYMLVLSAMAIAPVTSIAPAREVSIVVAMALGILVLGERGGRRRVISAVIITAGVLLVAVG